jgi:hypothetical protein
MPKRALLEINLARIGESSSYNVELRYGRPGDNRAEDLTSGVATVDLPTLFNFRNDRQRYGDTLRDGLLGWAEVKRAFKDACRDAMENYDALRIRMYLGNADSPLHAVRWETLSEPDKQNSWLLTNQRILFSRYLGRGQRPPIRFSPYQKMRVLVYVASPSELLDQNREYHEGGRKLYPVDTQGELDRVFRALSPLVPDTVVSDPKEPGLASLQKLKTKLAERYDVLYVVCHGVLTKADPLSRFEAALWLDEKGRSSRIPGSEFIAALQELSELPQLIVLASCQSAGSGKEPRAGDDGALAALGPGLALIGVPGVLAMQGNVSMNTIADFMPVFFEKLKQDGQIDGAVATARAAVKIASDSWMPTLFLALRDGCVWAPAGTATGLPGFQKWDALVDSIQTSECTVVLGGGFTDAVLVPQQQLARAWAKAEGLPLTNHGREDMAHVAQFISTMHSPAELRKRWAEATKAELLKRFSDPAAKALKLYDLSKRAGQQHRDSFPAAPHKILAKLPVPVFVTTTPDDLLADALRDFGKDPVVELCRWNPSLDGLPSVYVEEPKYRPTVNRPLVFHLLGHLQFPNSIVLTEDDYLAYLTRINKKEAKIPTVVEVALTRNPLLLLAFQVDDWDFRVLFRTIAAKRRPLDEGGDQPASVAVQLSPDDRFLNPSLVQSYLEKYFAFANVELSWGSTDEFVRELWRRWKMSEGNVDG